MKAEFIKQDGKCVIVAIDHGIAMGALDGIKDMENTIKLMIEGKADGLLLSYGTVKKYKELLVDSKMPFILRCDHFTSLITVKAPEKEGYSVTVEVEQAKEMGASAVMFYLVFGMNSTDAFVKNVETITKAAKLCNKIKLPLYVESVLWGKNFSKDEQSNAKYIQNICRIAAELGADIIKAPYSGSKDSFKDVVSSCYVPITVLGGSKSNDESEVLNNVKDAIDAGSIGVVFGRNIWQAQDPVKMLKSIINIVH